jgi:hypothetical protein
VLSNLGLSPEHFLGKFPFASAPRIVMHFNVSHSTLQDILSRELGLRKFSRRWMPISRPTRRKKCASILHSSELRCWINIPSCSSKELQSVTSHGSVTLLNLTPCLHAGLRKSFQDSDQGFRSKKHDSGVFHNASVNCLGCPLQREKYKQEYFVQDSFSLCSMRRSVFHARKSRSNVLGTWTI